ncbi:MAG: sigma 54-interacting transcriptional regulator [Desulfarculaceae bacterium]|jgi:PAS domain S-box-containing protein
MPLADIKTLRTVLDFAHNGLLIIDRTGKVLVFNRAAARVTGNQASEVLDHHLKETEPQVWEDMKHILATGEPQIGIKVAGRKSTIIANRSPIIRDGGIKGVISIFQDASDYEEVLKELAAYKELNEELDVIFNSSYDGLWVSDAQGKVVRVNPASERFAGVNAKEVIGRNVQDLLEEGYFDRSATLEVLKRRAAVSLIQKTKDGREGLVTGNPVYDDQGRIRLVVINARDFTDLKRLQTELEESRALTNKYRSELTHIHQNRDMASSIIMRSASMKRAFDMAMKVARVDSNVLIQGESGVGKSLIAKMIHRASTRQQGPLVQVDCAGIPASLIEAELFGYAKGAFTGARGEGKPGYFELAQDGTLFLDEVGELPINTQAKLLRFLEDNQVVRVGDTTPHQIDVRVIAATNRNLEKMVQEGEFRSDLFFRLNVVPLTIPPLRRRPEDIPPLVHHFLTLNNRKCASAKTVSPAVLDCLCRYSFPGNVRELANILEQMVVLSPGQAVEMENLPGHIRKDQGPALPLLSKDDWNLSRVVERTEKELITRALATYGSQREAARYLGIDHSTISRKARRYGISVAN